MFRSRTIRNRLTWAQSRVKGFQGPLSTMEETIVSHEHVRRNSRVGARAPMSMKRLMRASMFTWVVGPQSSSKVGQVSFVVDWRPHGVA